MVAKIYAEGNDGSQLENAIKSIEAWKAFEHELVTIRRQFLEKIISVATQRSVSAWVVFYCGQFLCPDSTHWYVRYDVLPALIITILFCLLIGILATTVHHFKT
jgi:hypothetical protein